MSRFDVKYDITYMECLINILFVIMYNIFLPLYSFSDILQECITGA